MSKRGDRTGETHGVFSVIGFSHVEKGRTFWKCICNNCKSEVIRCTRYFSRSEPVPKCCINCQGENSPLYKGYKDLSGVYLSRVEKQAIERGYSYNVTPEYLHSLLEKQKRKCYLTGLPLQAPSLDRIDNTIGYEVGNVAWCDSRINKMKGTKTLDEFIYLCSLVREPKVFQE